MPGLILPYQGKLPTIADDCFIAPNATIIGDVVIGKDSNVWFNVVIRGDVHEIRIGERTNIQDGTIIHATAGKSGTYIGNDITIGHNAVLHACTLEDGCFVGMSSTILDGAVVESGAMVAAGAVVTPGKRVKSGELWAGNPAKIMRELRPEDIAFFPRSAENYVKLAAQYRTEIG